MVKTKHKHDRRDKALRQEFIKLLLKFPVRDVKFSDKKVSLTFFNHRISDKIITKPENHVAEWSRRRKEIFIDKKITDEHRKKSFKALCVHEVIEKFLTEHFGFRTDTESHIVATRKEKEYLERLGGNWKSHELIVYWDWHRMGDH